MIHGKSITALNLEVNDIICNHGKTVKTVHSVEIVGTKVHVKHSSGYIIYGASDHVVVKKI